MQKHFIDGTAGLSIATATAHAKEQHTYPTEVDVEAFIERARSKYGGHKIYSVKVSAVFCMSERRMKWRISVDLAVAVMNTNAKETEFKIAR